MGSLVLAGATSGSTTITPSATGTYTITLPAETGTVQTSGAGFTTNGVAYASSTSALATGSSLVWTGSALGIGTSSPSYKTQITTASTNGSVTALGLENPQTAASSNLNATVDLRFNLSGSGAALIRAGKDSDYTSDANVDGNLQFYTNKDNQFALSSPVERMRLTSGGTLVLNPAGGSSTSPALDIYGGNPSGVAVGALRIGDSTYAIGPGQYWNIGRDNVFTGDFTFAANATVKANINSVTGVYTAISDIRLKKNIVNLNYGLAEVLRLRPVMYNMITEEENVKQHIGFIAQEVKAIIDESVDDLIDETLQFYGLDKSVFVPVLVKAIQELNTLITAQSATITSLTERITALEGART